MIFSVTMRGIEKLQQVIAAAGLGAAAAHLEAAKRMPTHHRAGAGAVDVNISRHQLGFDPLDVCRTAREKAGGQRIVDYRWPPSERLVEIAHFDHA